MYEFNLCKILSNMFIKLTNIIRFFALVTLMMTCSLATFAQACDADAGELNDIRYVVCDGEPFEVGSIGFNSNSDYSQVFILTAADRTVVAVSENGSFDALPSGEYRINPVNYANENAPTIPEIGDSFNDLLDQAGAACFDLTTDSVGVLFLNPIELVGEAFCDSTVEGSYFIRIFITGGFPEYADKGSYNLNFAPNSVQWDEESNYATGIIGPIPPTVEGFSIDVLNDGNLCSGGPYRVERGDLNVPCPKPPDPVMCIEANPGTMPSETVFAGCEQETVSAQTSGEELAEGHILVYVLHDSNGALGNVFATNTTGTFSLSDIDGGTTNTAYYISAIAGPDADEDGMPDENTEQLDCTRSNAGTPVVFLEPITVTHDAECDPQTQEYIVVVTVSGGLPAYDGSLYILDGAIRDEIGQLATLGPFSSGESYFFSIEDGVSCKVEFNGEKSCKKDPPSCPETSSPSFPSLETVYACAGSDITISANDLPTGDYTYVYILHLDRNNVLGSQVTSNTTGTFSTEDVAGFNLAFYVSLAIGLDEDGNGEIDNFGDKCTAIASGPAIVFLEPIVIDYTFECLPDRTYIVNVMASGGLPAFDGSNYQVGGSFNDITLGNITLGPFATGESFDIMLSDDAGCTASVVGPVVTCKPSPIECASFTGEVLTEGNMLKWTSATEVDNDFYTITRSTDGENFETIATVDGAGTSMEAINYSYIDKEATSGTSYYRITQTDFNGASAQVCEVVTLTRGEDAFGFINVGPIPVINIVTVVFNANVNTEAQINIYNITGEKVGTQNQTIQAGLNSLAVDMSDYTTGLYLISIDNGVEVITTKVMKN